ncbi:GNAT family N-acetyltransferase [Pulveribacter suum]|uniref:GNAT family N-acetyltransferase n=1 Tax=Pulveribacter suum TaxID=2116657 RepID=A0A2P1NH61_9BURK|nr:GNAT family N-acetyltransferase [Pulveribacter suum]AVP56372.1 GNAT family N-acetyltransferase [Pulveribacter suum]
MSAAAACPRPLAEADLPGLLAVQAACYGAAFVEDAQVYARRLASPAQCSLVLRAADGRVAAYGAAYRSRLGCVTPLHGDFRAVQAPDTLYLHDLAVLPAHAGQGLAGALLASLLAQARAEGLRHTALVAVQGAQGFWARQGYAGQPLPGAAQRRHLRSYGAGALYMARLLSTS